jgi:hypothetical protein
MTPDRTRDRNIGSVRLEMELDNGKRVGLRMSTGDTITLGKAVTSEDGRVGLGAVVEIEVAGDYSSMGGPVGGVVGEQFNVTLTEGGYAVVPTGLRVRDTESLPQVQKNNLFAGGAPIGTDDASKGYSIGSLWIDGTNISICTDATVGAAVWTAI